MADKKIDEVTHDDTIGGSEKLPMDDAGTAKYATTGDLKNYVIDQIEALNAADEISVSTDSLYLLKSGVLKPISAQTVAQAVLDYGFGLAGVSTVTGNELLTIKDSNTKKTMTATQLKNWIAANSTSIPWSGLVETDYDNSGTIDLADNDYLVFRDTSASDDKKIKIASYRRYQQEAFRAYVKSLSGLTGADVVNGNDLVYLIHTDGSGNESAIKATVAQLLSSAGISNPVSGPADPATGTATTEDYVPQWDSTARKLKNGLAVATTIRNGSGDNAPDDSHIPTESAVRTAISAISMSGVVKTTEDQTIDGTKTFLTSPVVPEPTQNLHAATKKYVDDQLVGSFVNLLSDQTVGGVKTFASSPVVPTPQNDYHAVTKKYVDDNYTSLAGTQTISGEKTFSTAPVVSATIPANDNTTKVSTTAWVVAKLASWWTSICGAAQSISGVWTFTSSPVVPTPTADMQACTKKYVDDNAVKLTGDQTVYGTKTFGASPVVPTVEGTTDSTTKAASTAFVQEVVTALDLRLKFVTKTFDASGLLTLDDRSINAFTLPVIESGSETTYTVNVPTDDSETHSRFFGIVLAVGSAASGSLELKLQTGPTYYAESADTFTIAAGSYNLILFREMKSSNEFLVSRRTLSATGTSFTGTIA